MMNFMMMTMATQTRAKRLVKLLERLLKKRELFDDDKLKLIVRNLEMLIDQLKTEVYSDVTSYSYDDIDPVELDYDKEYEGP